MGSHRRAAELEASADADDAVDGRAECTPCNSCYSRYKASLE